jgi:hypothetical protein
MQPFWFAGPTIVRTLPPFERDICVTTSVLVKDPYVLIIYFSLFIYLFIVYLTSQSVVQSTLREMREWVYRCVRINGNLRLYNSKVEKHTLINPV